MESDTPRTDAEEWMPADRDECVVSAYFARQLERDLAAAIKQRDEARRWLRDACAEIARIEERNGWNCFGEKEG